MADRVSFSGAFSDARMLTHLLRKSNQRSPIACSTGVAGIIGARSPIRVIRMVGTIGIYHQPGFIEKGEAVVR
jgi:hypothetical protein